MVVEFFDEPDKMCRIIEHLNDLVRADHIISWSAELNG